MLNACHPRSQFRMLLCKAVKSCMIGETLFAESLARDRNTGRRVHAVSRRCLEIRLDRATSPTTGFVQATADAAIRFRFISSRVSSLSHSYPPVSFPAPSLPRSRHPSLLHPQTYFPFTLPHHATAASSFRPISPRYLVSVENEREDKRFRWQA